MLPVSLTRVLLIGLLLTAAGCSYLRPLPTPILPPDELYTQGETEMGRKRYLEAREPFRKITERHPNSAWAPRARFLIGEAFYREAEFDKAIKEFETFLAFYPRHEIADLVQYRLSMAYYDQLKPIEQDQGLTAKSLEQKELWVAGYYFNQGNTAAARPRLEFVIKEYPRTLVIPEALFTLAEVNIAEGKAREANDLFRQLVNEYGYTEFGRRAAQRLRANPGAQR